MLKHQLNDKQQSIVVELNLQALVEDFFKSPDNYEVEMTDSLFGNMLFAVENFDKMRRDFFNEFYIKLEIVHGYRHPKSVQRLLNEGYNPSPTSDHSLGLALDIQAFAYKKVGNVFAWNRIQDTIQLQLLGKWIFANKDKYHLQQLGIYNNNVFRGGFHTGYNNKRKLSYFERI